METPSDSEDGFNDMPTRPMRIKVLYTFDLESKINCLARFSETLQVPVVQIDENAHVGVIALNKCLRSVVSASPELVTSSTTNDFAVYAYDYSEHDTPLVGQGMLSAALTTSSNDPSTPMITGRVCQNIPAIFSNGVKETLEVKLKLTPVQGVARVETRSIDIHRTASPATSAGFDPNAWNSSMHQMRPLPDIGDMFSFDDLATPGDDEVLADMLSMNGEQGVGITGTPTESMFSTNPTFAAHSHSAPGSRIGSPNLHSDHGTRNKQLRHQSFSVNTQPTDHTRPGSRGSVRSEYSQTQHLNQEQIEAFSPSYEEFHDEDGHARKRAKITQTDWRGKSSFGGRSADLRVTAATAASMQMYRPVATRPHAPGSNLEPPPRVPTPVPRDKSAPGRRGRPSTSSRSLLRQASTLTSDLLSDAEQMSDAVISSPDEDSPEASINGTPQDIPSSPPVFPGLMQRQSHSPRQFADSGYMSERNIENMNSEHFGTGNESCSPEFQPGPASRPFIKREESLMHDSRTMSDALYEPDLPEPGYFAGQVFASNDTRSREQRTTHSQQPYSQMSSRANSPLPNLAPAQSRGARLNNSTRRSSLALPTIARPSLQSEASAPSQLQRSYSQNIESEAGSPAPGDCGGRPTGPSRSGSGAPRRRIIEQRCLSAVAKGEMPQFCSHCGAIETPTWRRLYVKYVDGKPSPLDRVEGEGETIGIEELEYDDETGEVSKFVIRKSMKKTKDFQPGKGFEDTQICNSCGLWFVKMRSMRPQNKWGRKSGTRKSRKKNAGELMTDGIEPTSEACFTDAPGPDDNVDSQRPQLDNSRSKTSQSDSSGAIRSSIEARQGRRLSEGIRPQPDRAETALQRMTRSSPVKADGTQESPIELDDRTPKPTRRLLFPSPRQEGVAKTLDDGDVATSSSKSLPNATNKDKAIAPDTNMSVYGTFRLDKENMPPIDDDFSHLLNGSPSTLFKTPQKNLRRSPRTNKLLESPGLTSPSISSRKRKAALAAHSAQGKVANNDFMTSPASTRYFLRSTPTRLGATPGRHSQGNHNGIQDVSPFSRQLADMLKNDTTMVFTSPSQGFAFSDLPTFTSPSGHAIDWDNLEQYMASDFADIDTAIGES